MMGILFGLLTLLVLPLATGIVIVVFDREYEWWAPRVSKALIRFAVIALPAHHRGRYRSEWLGELSAQVEERQAGLLWAASILARAPQMGGSLRIRKTGRVYVPGEPQLITLRHGEVVRVWTSGQPRPANWRSRAGNLLRGRIDDIPLADVHHYLDQANSDWDCVTDLETRHRRWWVRRRRPLN